VACLKSVFDSLMMALATQVFRWWYGRTDEHSSTACIAIEICGRRSYFHFRPRR